MRSRLVSNREVVVALAVWLALVFAGFYVGSALAASAPPEPTVQVGAPLVVVVPPCTVPASVYNRHVRRLNAVRGKPVRKRVHHRPTCRKYAALKARLKAARADCVEQSHQTGASWYGVKDSGGIHGSCGPYLPDVPLSFAVLQSGEVRSRCGLVLYIADGAGDWLRVVQADTGGGGPCPVCGGHLRSLDFWHVAAERLNLTVAGIAVVRYSRRNCGAR